VPAAVTIAAAALAVCEGITNVGRSTGLDQGCQPRRTSSAIGRRGVTRGRGRRLAVAAAAAGLAAGMAACGTDAADQKVIDRLSKLDVLAVPPGATELSRTSVKGGGNSVIRTSSSVTLVYATTQTPPEVKNDFHARLGSRWRLLDNGAAPLGAWRAGGLPTPNPDLYPDTTADVEARLVTPTDQVPPGSQSVVTVEASATRPA
jgi:hypothetical protein